MDLLGREPHGVEIGAMGRPLRALRYVTAGQFLLDIGLGVHREPVSEPSLVGSGKQVSFAFASALAVSLAIIWATGVAK
jgi:hypothetical protein